MGLVQPARLDRAGLLELPGELAADRRSRLDAAPLRPGDPEQCGKGPVLARQALGNLAQPPTQEQGQRILAAQGQQFGGDRLGRHGSSRGVNWVDRDDSRYPPAMGPGCRLNPGQT